MVSRRLKLKPNRAEEAEIEQVLFQLAGVYNWAVRKLFWDARGGIFYSRYDIKTLVRGHGRKCGLYQEHINEMVFRAHRAHMARRVRTRSAKLKGRGNRMRCIPITGRIRWIDRTHLNLPGLGVLKVRPDRRFPEGRIKFAYVQKRARGWYVTLTVDGQPNSIPAARADAPRAGVDFGLSWLAVLSTGEKIPNPREYEGLQRRIGQAARARNWRLFGRLQQTLANTRRIRNHAISRDLLSRHRALYLSRDNYRGMGRTRLAKSVYSAAIYQLITMLHAKSRPGGCRVIEVSNRNSTRGCSTCGALTGPTGKRQLSVRQWSCGACGAQHDRDVNAAINALHAGAVLAHEIVREH
jgi:putative transposase